MRKLFSVVALMLMIAGLAHAGKGYTVTVSSMPIDTANGADFVCLVSSSAGPISIIKMQISKADSTVTQTVTVYENCNSTKTATALWVVALPSGTVNGESILTFDPSNPLIATRGIVVRKSSPDCAVKFNVLVR